MTGYWIRRGFIIVRPLCHRLLESVITERVETGSVDRVTLELRSDTEVPNGEFDWSLTTIGWLELGDNGSYTGRLLLVKK